MKVDGGVDVKIQIFLRRFISPGKSPRFPWDRRLGGLESRSGRLGGEKILVPTGTRTPTPRSSRPVAIPTTLSRLPIYICCWQNHLDSYINGIYINDTYFEAPFY
jgi:hypothetical protein